MNYLSVICLICFAAVVVNASSESAYYVPKGYYVIHADGQQSALSKITPSHQLLLHRLRRASQFSSSASSSSSSVSSNGGPVYFHQATSSHVSPGGISSQGFFGSLNDRFNGDDDDYYDDGPVQVPFNNNNRPTYSSSQVQTGSFAGNGFNGPTYSTFQTQTGNGPSTFIPNRINIQNTGSPYPNNGNTVVSHSSSISRPTAYGIQTQSTGGLSQSSNGNVVFTQTSNNGVNTQTSGIIYPNGQVQITSHKTGKF